VELRGGLCGRENETRRRGRKEGRGGGRDVCRERFREGGRLTHKQQH